MHSFLMLFVWTTLGDWLLPLPRKYFWLWSWNIHGNYWMFSKKVVLLQYPLFDEPYSFPVPSFKLNLQRITTTTTTKICSALKGSKIFSAEVMELYVCFLAVMKMEYLEDHWALFSTFLVKLWTLRTQQSPRWTDFMVARWVS